MAMTSPSPMEPHGKIHALPHLRRPQLLQNPPLNPRKESLGAIAALSHPIPAAGLREMSAGDSSDDEIPVPMKFSALTKALLDDEVSTMIPASAAQNHDVEAAGEENGSQKDWSDVPAPEVETAPNAARNVSYIDSRLRTRNPRRIVRLSGGSPSSVSLRRTSSLSKTQHRLSRELPRELTTPGQQYRSTKAKDDARSLSLSFGRNRPDSELQPSHDWEKASAPSLSDPRPSESSDPNRAHHHSNPTTARPRQVDEAGFQGSMRVKRVGKVSGSFLSGPARRGRRRQSEEDHSPGQDDQAHEYEGIYRLADTLPQESGPRRDEQAAEASVYRDARPTVEKPQNIGFTTGSPNGEREIAHLIDSPSQRVQSNLRLQAKLADENRAESYIKAIYELPAPKIQLSSSRDQENEPPPSFRKGNVQNFILQGDADEGTMPQKHLLKNGDPVKVSERRVLMPRSNNTPHRLPPPPPKMSVLDTATAKAGAATASSNLRKKRNQVTINGKSFTKMECIGRGGSSRVYRVIAENFKSFALKKVSLEDVDDIAIRGYKGEIDLLQKLECEERVVRLFDWELNNEKHSLSVLMEIGESDLNRILTLRLNSENAKFDISFTRHYWKEMLECVQAVHQHDVVHSDLKPANFLLVQGRLKLIDFGIANTIQDDTVNVHREQQVGTPNYMAPEAIIDTNAKKGVPANIGRCVKLGKASDIWSLGCILYQMAYGKPPFAHISNQIQRIMAIPNPDYVIDYPSKGVGESNIPKCLIDTLKSCLQRDQYLRPSIEQLLEEENAFLYPDAAGEGSLLVSQEILGEILDNVLAHCNKFGIPQGPELDGWRPLLFSRMKKALETGRTHVL
ncbi:MAG: Dual-specificity kinase, spindle pole body (SPB) duplication and spindle checkpoint function [Trizodia sp. TS-e1964]|nr:MAG: Dual-specificity kinase, spindle pole body (SPB) duplication and spindle checkpoint function [Trizodia sp. TS-e1964]